MKTQNIIIDKRKYLKPVIEKILLDNEISLVLNSNPFPPEGPNEGIYSMTPEYLGSNNPLKNNIV